MIILPHRKKLIENNFFEFSFNNGNDDEIKPDFEIFKSLNSFEQYYLAEIYNWDDGVVVLEWIIDSPKCDKGTASNIFWSAEPDYYFDFTNETIDEYEKDIFDLLQKILRKFNNDEFKKSKIKFDPIKSGYRIDWKIEHKIWEFTDELKKSNKRN
jgi:hypothetical protein